MRLRQLSEILRADLRPDTVRGTLIRSAGKTAVLKVGAVLLAFLASLLYARALGPRDYGLYAFVMAWTALLTIPTSLGFPQYLIREGAKRPQSWRSLERWADARVAVMGTLAAIGMLGYAFATAQQGLAWIFAIAAPLPLLNGFVSVRSALLQAHNRVTASQWPNLILAPALVLTALCALWLWRGHLSGMELLTMTLVSAPVPLLINAWQLQREPSSPCDSSQIVRISGALPFMWINGLYLINSRADLIILGSIAGPRDAGIYAVACRAAELISFFLTIANMVAGPRISALYQEGDRDQLQRLATAVAKRVLLATAPFALILIFGADPLVRLFYGEQYAEAATALRILGTAQLFAIAAGALGILLNMTEHAGLSAKAFAFSAALNVGLNILLVPRLGITGAALSTASSLVGCTLIRWYMVRRHLQLKPSIFGF